MDGKRKDELAILENLLRDCRDINSSSHVLERLQRIVSAAELLTKTDYNTCEPSFWGYLVDQLHKQEGKGNK